MRKREREDDCDITMSWESEAKSGEKMGRECSGIGFHKSPEEKGRLGISSWSSSSRVQTATSIGPQVELRNFACSERRRAFYFHLLSLSPRGGDFAPETVTQLAATCPDKTYAFHVPKWNGSRERERSVWQNPPLISRFPSAFIH